MVFAYGYLFPALSFLFPLPYVAFIFPEGHLWRLKGGERVGGLRICFLTRVETFHFRMYHRERRWQAKGGGLSLSPGVHAARHIPRLRSERHLVGTLYHNVTSMGGKFTTKEIPNVTLPASGRVSFLKDLLGYP